MSDKKIKVSEQALNRARDLGMFGQVERRLQRMSLLSAPYRHEVANRRFGEFLLVLDGDELVDLARMDPTTGQADTEPLRNKLARRQKAAALIAKHFSQRPD